MTKLEWFEQNGFNADGYTYLIGGKTFENKDCIKENGGKFNREIKWHMPEFVQLPDGCCFSKISFDDLYVWDENLGKAFPKTTLKEFMDNFEAAAAGPSLSQFYGEIGVRFRDVRATYLATACFDSAWGRKCCHKFQIGDDKISWFTQKELEIEPNTEILLSGTPKEFQVFRHENVTICQRCVIKEI